MDRGTLRSLNIIEILFTSNAPARAAESVKIAQNRLIWRNFSAMH